MSWNVTRGIKLKREWDAAAIERQKQADWMEKLEKGKE